MQGVLVAVALGRVAGHGRLREPPGRSSMWRFGFDTPHNVNDHETNCGGFGRQWDQVGGRRSSCRETVQITTTACPEQWAVRGLWGRLGSASPPP